MNVMIFLLGGCAGWAIHSVVTSYKRRKTIRGITDLINKAISELSKDEDGGKSEPIDASDIFKIINNDEKK